MKFANFQKLFAILFCMMLLADVYVCSERRIRQLGYPTSKRPELQRQQPLKSVQRQQPNKPVLQRQQSMRQVLPSVVATPARVQQTTTALRVTNKWGRLAVGILEGVVGNETTWYQCLPSAFTMEVPDVAGDGAVQEGVARFGELATVIYTRIKTTISAICEWKTALIDTFVEFLGFIKGRKRFFLEGRFVARRGTTRRDFKSFINSAKNAIKSTWTRVTSFVQSGITFLSTKLTEFRDMILNLFGSQRVRTIISIGQCAYSIYKGVSGNKNLFTALTDKFISKLTGLAAVTSVGGIVVKVLFQLMCQVSSIEAIINYAAAALRSTNTAEKFYLWGKVVGTVVNVILNVATGIIGKRRFKK